MLATLWLPDSRRCPLPSALVSTAFAYVIFFRILSTAGATNLVLVTCLIPVSAIVLGVIVLGETLNAAQVGAFGIALAGVVLATLPGRGLEKPVPVEPPSG